jgi:ATP-dependent RNA helicase DeaD
MPEVEQDGRDTAAVGSGIARSQNVLYVMPHDWASISQFLAPVLHRVDDASPQLQALVVTSDPELAAAAAAAAVKVLEGRTAVVLAATSAKRAARLLRIRPAQVVAGPPETLVELVRAAALKLDTVRAVCIAWADELLSKEALGALEILMVDLPKDASRTVVAAEMRPAVDELLERYARRARRVVAPSAEGEPIDLEYVAVARAARLDVLRRVLDEIDPRSAMVFARESETEVRTLLRALGYDSANSLIAVGHAAGPETDLVVLFDLPATRGELREACGAAARTVALIRPRQLASLRALTGGGAVRSLTITDASARARDRDARLRAELRDVLVKGQFGRDLLALEPLLEEFDGIEIAAAATQLLENVRASAVPPAAAAPAPRERHAPSGPMVRLFVNVGTRDSARPADLLGAIVNEGGVGSGDVGRIDVRESHSIVEVSASAADAVIERVTGTPIRGRRAIVRRDEERPRGRDEKRPRGRDEERPRGERPRGDRGERPQRDRGDRPAPDRGARPARKDWGARSPRPPRRDRPEDRE